MTDAQNSSRQGNQWALRGLVELARDTAGGSPEIQIAVVDGPVDTRHECFVGARLEQLATGVAQAVGSTHGTHVTSVIFGQRGSSVEGIEQA